MPKISSTDEASDDYIVVGHTRPHVRGQVNVDVRQHDPYNASVTMSEHRVSFIATASTVILDDVGHDRKFLVSSLDFEFSSRSGHFPADAKIV